MRTSARMTGAMAAAAAIALLMSGCGSSDDGKKDDKSKAGTEKSGEPTSSPSQEDAGKGELPGVWSTQTSGEKLMLTVVGDAVSLLQGKKMCNGHVMKAGADKSLMLQCPAGVGEERTNGKVTKVTAKSLTITWNGGASDTYTKSAEAPAKLPKNPGELSDVPGLPDKLKKVTEQPGKVREYPGN